MDFIDTTDRDEAAQVFGLTFPDIEIRREMNGHPFRFRYSRAARGEWARTALDIHGDVTMPGTFPHNFAVGRRLRGYVSIAYGDARLDTAHAYLRPRGASVARFHDAQVELLIIERPAFEARARRLLESSGRTLRDPRPENSAPPSLAQRRLWAATADALAPLFTVESPVADAILDDLATAALLTAFPLTDEGSRPRGTAALPRTIRRATEFADGHLADPVTVGMLADAARVSVRTVQEGFRRHLGVTPVEYVRNARLHAARRALQESGPEETTVADICRSYGFAHPSRFARDYSRAFGEYPSDTLRG